MLFMILVLLEWALGPSQISLATLPGQFAGLWNLLFIEVVIISVTKVVFEGFRALPDALARRASACPPSVPLS